jgi:L-cysteine S-thiosulfotransferase
MLTLLLAAHNAAFAQSPLVPYTVKDGAIAKPFTNEPGVAARGHSIAMDRDLGNCTLCHALPDMGKAVAGNIGPPLAGVGARLGAGQLRLRLTDSTLINPDSVMPAYHRVEGLTNVAAQYRGKPALTAQQVEDLVAYLQTLR